MPDPYEGESREDFVRRCIPIVISDGTAETTDQAVAICNSMFESGKAMNTNDQLLRLVRERKSGERFGYGLTTADRYVEQAVTECGSDLCRGAKFNVALQIKDAQQKLAHCGDNYEWTKQSTNTSDFTAMVPEDVIIPQRTLMVFQHTVTTPREDRDRDVLVTEGADLDPKAPLLWQHLSQLPIGKTLATLEHSPERLRTASALLDMNELTNDAALLIEAEALRISHGFRALEFEERKESNDHQAPLGFRVTKYEIMEVSLVSVPSNVDAEIELWSRGKIKSAEFSAHAKHHFDKRNKSVPTGDGIPSRLKTLEVKPDGQLTLEFAQGDAVYPEDYDADGAKDYWEKQACGCGGAKSEPSSEPAQDDVKAMVGMTGESDGHTHRVNLDDDGNGQTSSDDGHMHAVEGYEVQESDGHTHTLDRDDLIEREAGDQIDKSEDTDVGDLGLPEKSSGEANATAAAPGSPLTVTHPETGEQVPDEKAAEAIKAGRVLSKANLAILKDVRDDVRELGSSENMDRKEKALCRECAKKLDGVISAAGGDDEDEGKDAIGLDPNLTVTIGYPKFITDETALKHLLANASDETQQRALEALQAMKQAEESERVGAQFRQLTKV